MVCPSTVASGVALGTAGLFSGAALYVSLVEHRNWKAMGPEYATQLFHKGFWNMAKMQGGLAGACSLASFAKAAMSRKSQDKAVWIGVGSLYLFMLPYTKVALMPVNATILIHGDKGEVAPEALFEKWGKLHAVRTVVGISAFAISVFAVLKK